MILTRCGLVCPSNYIPCSWILYIHFEVANGLWRWIVWKLHVGGSAVLHVMESINTRISMQWNTAEFANVLHFTMLLVCSAHHTPSYWMQLLFGRCPLIVCLEGLLVPYGVGLFTGYWALSELDLVLLHFLVSLSFFPKFTNVDSWIVLMMHITSMSLQSWTKISHFLCRNYCLFVRFSASLSRYCGVLYLFSLNHEL